jgi:hypothetical protein
LEKGLVAYVPPAFFRWMLKVRDFSGQTDAIWIRIGNALVG